MGSKFPGWAIVPAAGIGRRMGGETAKQYLQFQGKTILEHSLDRLLTHPEIEGAVVVVSANDHHFSGLGYQADKTVLSTVGGQERHHSVYNGLIELKQKIGPDVTVLVHDAVRPLVNHRDLDAVIRAARQHRSGAILASRVTDTLKIQAADQSIADTLSREGLWQALTPQAFHLPVLLDALHHVIEEQLMITDDSQAVEMAGFAPVLVPGSADNFKITTPADLALAEKVWLNQRNQQKNK